MHTTQIPIEPETRDGMSMPYRFDITEGLIMMNSIRPKAMPSTGINRDLMHCLRDQEMMRQDQAFPPSMADLGNGTHSGSSLSCCPRDTNGQETNLSNNSS